MNEDFLKWLDEIGYSVFGAGYYWPSKDARKIKVVKMEGNKYFVQMSHMPDGNYLLEAEDLETLKALWPLL